MQEIILDSLVPIFVGMALGCLGGWTHHVDNRDVAQLNVLVMNFALPAAVLPASFNDRAERPTRNRSCSRRCWRCRSC
jgi:hypothetical protein